MSGELGLLDRSRRHLHRRDRPAAGRHARHPQAAVGKSRGLSATPRCRASATCSASRPASRSRRAHRRGEDGHHGRHQCAARAQGRAHAAADHQGLSRCAADRLPGAAEDLRQAHHQAGHAVRARGRGRRARARRRHGRARARSRRGARRARTRARPTASARSPIVFMHAYRYPEHEQRVAALAREMGFPQVSVSHEVSPLIKLVGRGDTTVVDAYLSPILRRYVAQVAGDLNPSPCGGGSGGRRRESVDAARFASRPPRQTPPHRGRENTRLMFMMSSGGLTAAELFQGKDAILSGPAGGVVGMAETGARRRLPAADRLRHGRHLDRRVAFRRRVRARVRDRGRRRAHARADDADPHGRGRRRLDPAFRRRALSRRPGLGRRQSGPDMLSPRRPARRHRRQCHGRQADSRISFRRFSGPQQDQPLDADAVRTAFAALAEEDRRRPHAARRSPTASSRSRSRTWRTRSRRFRCSAATT